MTGNRGAMPPSSAEGPILSDLAKVDSYELTDEDYDEIPELTDEMIARANLYVNGRLVRPVVSSVPPEPAVAPATHRTRKTG